MRTSPLLLVLVGCGGLFGKGDDDRGTDDTGTQSTGRIPTTDETDTTPVTTGGPNLFTTSNNQMCIVLFGGNDRVEGPDEGVLVGGAEITPLPFGTEPRTVQAWVRTRSTKQQVAVSYGRSSVGQGFQIGTESGFPFVRTGWSASLALTGDEYIADDEWHHLAAAWDGSTAFLTVDGVVVGAGPLSGETLEGDVVVGNTPPGDFTKSWVGWVDDVKILDVTRQPAAIGADMDAEAVDPANVLLWWDFDAPEGSMGPGIPVEDLSGNLHTGITAGVDSPQFLRCR